MITNLLPRFRKKGLLIAAAGAAISIAAVACGDDNPGAPAAGGDGNGGPNGGEPTPPPSSGIQSDYDAVRLSLEASGAVVVRSSEERSGIFDNPVTNVLVNGEEVAIYEFPSVADATAATLNVSDDGMLISYGESPVVALDFLYRPHYFQHGSAIVVYTGNNVDTIRLLRDRFGEEFAGDKTEVDAMAPNPGMPRPDYETVLEPAPIESVVVGEDADEPGLYYLYVTSGLPSGCASFADWSVKQTGELELTLTMLNRVPAPGELVACTDIYGIVRHTVPLGSAADNLDACEVYTVRWEQYGEEKSLRFQVLAPNVRCAAPEGEVVAPIIGGPDGFGGEGVGEPGYPTTPGKGPIDVDRSPIEIDALIARLNESGLDVERTGEIVNQQFFQMDSEILLVNGERVNLYSFGSHSVAYSTASRVSADGYDYTSLENPDGTTRVVMVEWVYPPHFYLVGSLVMLYVGDHDDVIDGLDHFGGLKFAGPDSKPVTPPDEPTNPVDVAMPPSSGGSVDPDQVDPPLPAPGLPAPDGEVDFSSAPIVSVGDVVIAESFPPQYFVQITSAQPNGCYQDAGWEVLIEDTNVFVDVLNSHPANLAVVLCIALYGETEHNVALGSDGFVSGEEYSLYVNGEAHGTFTAQ